MRIFLIVVSFINTLFYVLIYAYYDTILDMVGSTSISAGAQNFFKVLVLIIAGFCIGLLTLLYLNLKMRRSYFEVKNLLLIGIVPFLLLIFSAGPINSFIVSRFFSERESIQELIFYLFSRQVLWSIWFGFAIGTSVRIDFKKGRHKHAVSYAPGEDNVNEPKSIEDNWSFRWIFPAGGWIW